MKLLSEEVKNIAKLARLELTEEQVGRFGAQMASMLEYFTKLNEIETEGVEETSQVTGLENVFRPDVREPFGKEEELVNQSYAHEANQVKVPNVL